MSIIVAIQMAINNLGKPSTYNDICNEIVRGNLYQPIISKEKLLFDIRRTLKIHTEGVNKFGGSSDIYFRIVATQGNDSLYDNTINNQKVIRDEKPSSSEGNKKHCDRWESFKYNFRNKLKLFSERNANNWSVHKTAMQECFWMLLGAFAPIIIDSIVRRSFLKISLYDAMVENTKSGEVFIFTSALVTPFFFFLIMHIKKRRVDDELPYFGLVLFITLSSLISGLCAFVYYRTGVMMLDKYFHGKFTLSLGGWAWIIYFLSLGVWYYSAYMNHKTSNYTAIREKQTKDLEKDFNYVKEH